MRKINLSVQTPCHEDWNQMHAEEKGRFCVSCCKTVTDFTGMNDRQLAEFFKKPKENICGRFYADQLERDIPITRKRIPWLRYFFQFTLPAFVLFLKSCGQRSEVTGDVVSIKEQPLNKNLILLDGLVEEIKVVEITEPEPLENFQLEANNSVTMGIIMPVVENIIELPDTIPSLKKQEGNNEVEDTIVIAKNEMDTVVICSIPDYFSRSVVMGGIGMKGIQIQSNEPDKAIEVKPAPVPRIFPNPASAGSLITIAYKEEETMPDMVQIFTVAGQLVRHEIISISKDATVFNLNLPSSLKPGMYLLKFTDSKNNLHHTEKLVIQ